MNKQSVNQNLIFDFGMHIGQDTEFYLAKGFDVVAVEANPILVAEAESKFSEFIKSGRLVIVNSGISDETSSRIPFYVNHQYSEWSSFIEDIGARGGKYHTINIDVLATPVLFQKYGTPYYLKIDIEGFDLKVIQSLRDVEALPTYISAENGQENMIRELSSLGYQSFKFLNQALIEGRKSTIILDGQLVKEHIFPHGASGEFGEDTCGQWMNLDDVIKVSQSHWQKPNLDANVDGWYDIHARLF